MRTRRYIALILTLLSNYSFLVAQSGLSGKHTVVKANILTPLSSKGVEAEVEFGFFRHVSLSLGIRTSKSDLNQWSNVINGGYGNKGEIGKGHIDSRAIYIKYRKYSFNKAMPALFGSYIFVTGTQGYINAKGKNEDRDGVKSYELNNIRSSSAEVGLGKQIFIKKRLAIDTYLGFGLTGVEMKESYETYLFWLAKRYSQANIANAAIPLSFYDGKDGVNVYNTHVFNIGFSAGINIGYFF